MGTDFKTSRLWRGIYHIGALIIRIGFWGPLYYTYLSPYSREFSAGAVSTRLWEYAVWLESQVRGCLHSERFTTAQRQP